MNRLGPLIAAGRTSDIYAFGRDSVVKVPRPGVPDHWAELEAEFTAAVHDCGLPTPEVRGIERIHGKPSVVFERIDGPSMWERMLVGRTEARELAILLAEVHGELRAAATPTSLPDLTERVRNKIDEVEALDSDDKTEARRIVGELPQGGTLNHGDLHPGNILLSRRGPVVIDWFDASIGASVADVVRTSLLIRPTGSRAARFYLPGSSPAVLDCIHRTYLSTVLASAEIEPEVISRWEAVLAVSRLAERIGGDEAALIGVWAGRDGGQSTPLMAIVSDLVRADDQSSN